MPQFDFTTYSSQIFWFLLCFITLYLVTSCIILPRIRSIIEARKNITNSDISSARKLQEKINSLQIKATTLRQDASQKYHLKLEEAAKQAALEREKITAELKEKIDQDTKKSRLKLSSFLQECEMQSVIAVQNLLKIIKAKILD